MNDLLSPVFLVGAPVVIALLIALSGRAPRPVAPLLALIGPLLTLFGAAGYFLAEGSSGMAEETVGSFALGRVATAGAVRWFSVGDVLMKLNWTVDGLAALMLLAVGLVAACVVVFSAGYMAGDAGWARYFALLSLFTGSMNLVVIAASFPAVFIGWELVGACSFLLIGFWYRRPAAAAAATKAFITTRVGDVGFLLGISVLWAATREYSYAGALDGLGTVSTSVATLAAVSIAVGAIGKSAQFPLHAWLPDAMEGPTPVSALIHAATMVAAGVYLVVRLWPLFEAAPMAKVLLLAVGSISAVGAALAAVVQRDIKRVLAYSTVSQLGFMFVALGLGAWLAAFFHLVAHASFKALLFLTSGSVIHGSGTQDMREMGGLRRAMPFTFSVWVIGVLALSGIPPLAGFFSKDLLLESVWHQSPAVGLMLLGVSAVTALYSARATRLVFFGEARGDHAHESPLVMVAPLGVLAASTVVLGWFAGGFAETLATESEPLNLALSAAAVASAALGAAMGWLSAAGAEGDERTAAALGKIGPLLHNAYYWDRFVDRVAVRPAVGLSRGIWAVGDRFVIDGTVEGSARFAKWIGRSVSRLQSGDAQSYAGLIALGFVLMMVATVWLGR